MAVNAFWGGFCFSTDKAVGLSHLQAPPKAESTPLQDVAKCQETECGTASFSG